MECEFYTQKSKDEKCANYVRAVNKNGKRMPHGYCAQYQCIHNPIYMVRYDMYISVAEKRAQEEEQMKIKEELEKMSKEVTFEQPSLTEEDMKRPAKPPKKYAKVGDVLKAVGLKTEEEHKLYTMKTEEEIEKEKPKIKSKPTKLEEVKKVLTQKTQPTPKNIDEKIVETEKKMFRAEIQKTKDIKKLQSIIKSAETRNYADIVIFAKQKIESIKEEKEKKEKEKEGKKNG